MIEIFQAANDRASGQPENLQVLQVSKPAQVVNVPKNQIAFFLVRHSFRSFATDDVPPHCRSTNGERRTEVQRWVRASDRQAVRLLAPTALQERVGCSDMLGDQRPVAPASPIPYAAGEAGDGRASVSAQTVQAPARVDALLRSCAVSPCRSR